MLETILKGTITMKVAEKRHAAAMFDFVERNRDYFIDVIPFVSRTAKVSQLEELITKYLDKYARGTGVFYGLWDSGSMIGLVLIRDIDEAAQWAEIGYMIDEKYSGKGLVKESCRRLINFLFTELEMQKIVICCTDANEGSKAVAKSLGFTLEGNLRRNSKINGKLRNTAYFGLLREEWADSKK